MVDPAPLIPGAAGLPLAPGVYRFRDQAGRVLYVGRAVSLRRRVLSYGGDLGDRGHLAPMVARIARVEAVVCDSAHEAAWLERNLLRRRLPPWNRSPGGQEAEVWIRLSESARTPGVTVVRQPASGDFGPYLGGQKVRDAVSGLGRVLPLGYAADGPAGTERDMARVRGASPAARAALARSITAVLRRDQAAVGLGARRTDRAPRGRCGRAGLRVRRETADRTRGPRLDHRGAEGRPGARMTRTCAAGRTACWSASRSATAGCPAGGSGPAGPPPPASPGPDASGLGGLRWSGGRAGGSAQA